METITGVFESRGAAERALDEITKLGIRHDKVTLLVPGTVDRIERELESIPIDTTEQPGMGKAVGALVGGAVGISGASFLMALVPGLGPVTALGLLGEAILGAAGATIGATAGGKAERVSYAGLPEDEIFVYEDALRKGRSLVVVLADDAGSATAVRNALKQSGAESVDAAREQWWTGLRSAEESHYLTSGRSFAKEERFYRLGFEAALHARTRCMEFDQVSAEMTAALEDVRRRYPDENVEEPFTRGYQRGREYYQHLCDESNKAA